MQNVLTMRKLFMLIACILVPVIADAEDSVLKNGYGAKMRQSNFHLGVDLQTKYIWRGMEMITDGSTPVLFPHISYQNKGLYVYAMGATALNGNYVEVDMGLSYTWKWLTVGVNDYYYPTVNGPQDKYFDCNRNTTGHWLEAAVTVAPEKIPAYLTVSNFFYGADKTPEGKQAYSTYVELGTYYDFLDNNRLSLAVGAACNKSCYTGYETGFAICNLELKYTYTVVFNNGWSIPLNVAYIINPVREKSFINFSTSFAF